MALCSSCIAFGRYRGLSRDYEGNTRIDCAIFQSPNIHKMAAKVQT